MFLPRSSLKYTASICYTEQYKRRDFLMKIQESAEITIPILQGCKGLTRSINIVNESGYSKPSVSIAQSFDAVKAKHI